MYLKEKVLACAISAKDDSIRTINAEIRVDSDVWSQRIVANESMFSGAAVDVACSLVSVLRATVAAAP